MKPDFFLIPNIVREAEGLRPSDWFIYATVYWFEHMGGNRCFASNATIAKAAGMGERTVSRALENLEKLGFIERDFVDRGKTRRTQIHARVFFAVTPSLFGEGSPGGRAKGTEGVAQMGELARPSGRQSISKGRVVRNTAAPKTAAAPAKPFISEETKKKWYDGDRVVFQLLAWYFDKKGMWRKFESEAQVRGAVKRHIRSAHELVKGEWSQKQCNAALAKMLEANPKMRGEWTIDTLIKYLTK